MKNTEVKLNKQITKLKNQLVTDVSAGLSASMHTVCTAMDLAPDISDIRCKDIVVLRNAVCRIHPNTGELHNYIVRFDSIDEIWTTIKFLEAYLTTNQDVLEAREIYKLNKLIDFWREIV